MALRHAGVPSPARRQEDASRPRAGRLRQDEHFDSDDASSVRTWFAGAGWPLLIRLCDVARAVKKATEAVLMGTGAMVTPREVGAWALRTVGTAHWDGIDEPTLDDLADRMRGYREQQVAEGPLRRLRMKEPGFLEAVAAAWDAAWPPDRPARLPLPSTLGLGGDSRPPLSGWKGNWHHGTDRSVFSRYESYFDASSRVDPPSEPSPPPALHVTRRFEAEQPVDVALTEVGRAAAPLGLSHAAHRAALVATAAGLRGRVRSDDGQLGALDLAGWCDAGDDLPAEVDESLAAAVRTHTVGWTARARLAGELDVGDHSLPAKILRRLWHRLHGREVEWEFPLGRAGFASDLTRTFGHHLRERHDPPPSPRERPPRTELPSSERTAERQERVAATNLAIREHPDGPILSDLLIGGDPAWKEVYRRIVHGRPGLLTLAEFCAEWGLPPEGDLT